MDITAKPLVKSLVFQGLDAELTFDEILFIKITACPISMFGFSLFSINYELRVLLCLMYNPMWLYKKFWPARRVIHEKNIIADLWPKGYTRAKTED